MSQPVVLTLIVEENGQLRTEAPAVDGVAHSADSMPMVLASPTEAELRALRVRE